MSTFKSKLRKEVVAPVVKNNGTAFLEATVLKSSKGSYVVELYDADGNKKIKKGVKARVYGNDTPGAYKVGDKVQIEFTSSNRHYEIVNKLISDYDAYKSEYELKNDVYSSMTADVLLGFIL